MRVTTPNQFVLAKNIWDVFVIFLRLGLTSFGGPVAHLGYFRTEFVTRKQWLSEAAYADLVALCQFLPGPTSSQVGMAIGIHRTGFPGAVAAWLGFTLPSAVILTAFAVGVAHYSDPALSSVLHGLKVAAVAVVAQAVWGMGRNLCRGPLRLFIMIAATTVALMFPTIWWQLGVIVAAGLSGFLLIAAPVRTEKEELPDRTVHGLGLLWLVLFLILLIVLPLLSQWTSSRTLSLIDVFYRAGALVFGGGHVILPLLQSELVPSGMIDSNAFLAGYAAAQAVPGPLFSFAAFLGASMSGAHTAWISAFICLVAVFAPSFLLLAGILPFWGRLKGKYPIRSALSGVNAAVVGLLLATLYNPVWTSSVISISDFFLVVTAFLTLTVFNAPPWLVVLGTGVAGLTLHVIN